MTIAFVPLIAGLMIAGEAVKDLVKESNPFIEGNIFKSVENVNLDTVVAYKKNGERHHFPDTYNPPL